MNNNEFDLAELAQAWPSRIVAREQKHLDRFSGGILNQRSLANADAAGKGPRGKIRIGRKVAYPVDSLIEWMKTKVVNESTDNKSALASLASQNPPKEASE